MWNSGDFGGSPTPTRKFRIGASVSKGQVVVKQTTGLGTIGDPASVNDYTEAIGIAYEDGTYAASSPGVLVKASYSPLQLFQGLVSGGTSADTAWTTAVLLTQDTASTTVLADTAVADLDYIAGVLVSLAGATKGEIRGITGQSDNTSTTVTVPFSANIAIGGTALRTYDTGVQGIELTTDFCQFNGLLASGEALITTALGDSCTVEVYIDDHAISETTKINIKSATAPKVVFECIFTDHAFNSVA